MALLFEIANYSLKGLSALPQEVACASQARNWEIPGELNLFKEVAFSLTSVQATWIIIASEAIMSQVVC